MQIENQDNMSEKNLAIFGLYTHKKEAEWAISRLEKNGFPREDISMLAPQPSGHRNFVYDQKTCVQEGALIGSVVGFFILGLVGLLWGLRFPMDVKENIVPFWLVSAGTGCIMGILFGAAAGALVGIGTPKSAAKRYGFYLKEGGIILSVHLKNETDRQLASQILETTHGQDISRKKKTEYCVIKHRINNPI